MTGLPFVFAAWVSTVELDAQFISDFNAVLEKGVQHIVDAVEEDYKPGLLSKDKTLDYLQNKIDYRLDADKIQALNLFLEYIAQL
jgi:chorismate dehydratase